MLRTKVPSCTDLVETAEFQLSSGGSVLLQGRTIESHNYCIDRSVLWYCITPITR